MTTFYLILFSAVFVAVNALNPFYVKAQRDGPNKKSLALKMTCATGYLVTCLCSMLIAQNFSKFAWLIFGGLVLSWIGDLFLHLWQHKIFHAIGFLGFLSAHFLFIAAFLTEIKILSPAQPFFTWPEAAGVLLFCVGFVVFSMMIGTDLKSVLVIPVLVYAAVITTMLCKSIVMGVLYFRADGLYAWPALIAAAVGAALFVTSDFSIAILMFNEKYKKNYPLKMFNMVTYFLAVLLLSSLPMLVR